MLHEAAFRLHVRCSGSKHVMFGLGSQPQGVLGIYKYPKVHKYLKWFWPPACQRRDAHPVIGCQLQALPAPVLCVFTQDQGRGPRWRTRVEDQGEGQEAECQSCTLQVACTMRTGRGSSTGSCRVAWTSGMLGQVGRVHLKRNKQEALDSGLKMCLPKRGEGRSWLKLDGSGVLSAEPRRAQSGTWCRGINESPGPRFTERPCPPQGPAGSQAAGGTGRSCGCLWTFGP